MNLCIRERIWLLGIMLAVVLAGCHKKSASVAPTSPEVSRVQPVEVVPVARRDLVESLSLVGSLAANETTQLRTEIAGQVREVLFNEGEPVVKGQVLLKMDNAELKAQLAQAEARYHLAELNLKRSQNLTEAQSMSQAEADRFGSEFSTAEANLALLRVRLDKTEIKAPFDGVAGSRTISPGDYLTISSTTAPITTIDDLSRLKADFQVPERYTSKIKPGSTFTVRAQTPHGEARAEGEVYFISSVIDRNTRSTQVKGYINRPPADFKPGMFAGIELVLSVRKHVATVPEGALLNLPDGVQIVLAKPAGTGHIADFVPVRTGLRAKGYVEVDPLHGDLKEGDQVVASGVGALILFPGAPVELRPLSVAGEDEKP